MKIIEKSGKKITKHKEKVRNAFVFDIIMIIERVQELILIK